MTVISLVQRVIGTNSRQTALHDVLLETGGIAIDQDAYTPGLDRIYNVKRLRNMVVEIQNTGGSNGLTFKIEKARKEYGVISTLVDADFDEGANSVQNIENISPQTTAIRIRIKRQTAGQNTTLAGHIGVN